MSSVALALIRVATGRSAVLVARKKVPADAQFKSMLVKRRKELRALNRKLQSGQITVPQWADAFEAILLEGHTQAAYMGRLLAIQKGDVIGLVDLLRGQAALDLEIDFARRFRDQLIAEDSRYWDGQKWKLSAIEDRQVSYFGKMRGTANQAFIEDSPADADIYWRTGAAEDHCVECPEYEAMSPWKRDEIPTWPGDNDTPCKFECDCHIEINGVNGFKPVRL